MGVKVDFKVNVPHGEMDITENGQYDVSDYAIANVNVAFETEEKNVTITENGTQEVLPSIGKDALSKVVINTEIPIKEEQSKNVEIKENGTISVLPDEGKVLNEVSITTNVPQSGVPEKGVIFSDYDSEGYPHTATIKDLFTSYSTPTGSVLRIPSKLFYTQYSGSPLDKNFIGQISKIIINNTSSYPFNGFSEYCFDNLSNLKEINYEGTYGNDMVYQSYSFYNTGFENLILKNVSSCESYSFGYMKKLKSIIFNNCTFTSIGNSTFNECTSLTSIEIPSSVRSIGYGGLKIGSTNNKATITFKSDTPPTIQSSTFDATKLNKIYVPSASLEAYKTATNWVAFANYIEADPNE